VFVIGFLHYVALTVVCCS